MKIEKYKSRVEHNVSDSTLSSRLSGQRHFEKFIGGGEPTIEDVEEWVDHLIEQHKQGEIKASTIREYFKAVRYYFRVIKGDEDGFDQIREWLPKNDADPGDYLTEDEWDRMMNEIHNPRYKTIFKIMYHYARRPMEVILLNEEDIDFDEDSDEPEPTITFNILKKKEHGLPVMKIDDREFRVFRATFELEDEVAEVLKSYMKYHSSMEQEIEMDGEEITVSPLFTTNQGRISYDSVWREIKKAAARANIDKNITPKTMRHSRATHLDWAGNAPGNIARDMLIHDPDTNVIGRYIHDRDESEVRSVMSTDDG